MAERLKVEAPSAGIAGVERDSILTRVVLFGSPYRCGYGFTSTPSASGAVALFGLAFPLTEPRLENWRTRQRVAINRPFPQCLKMLNSPSRWWGGRAVEGTSLENWQTRQGLEGSNPSPTVCRAAGEPIGSRRLLKRRNVLSLRSITVLSSAQDEVFTLPTEERIPPPPFVEPLAACCASCDSSHDLIVRARNTDMISDILRNSCPRNRTTPKHPSLSALPPAIPEPLRSASRASAGSYGALHVGSVRLQVTLKTRCRRSSSTSGRARLASTVRLRVKQPLLR